jgi:hypothetical protein
MRIFESIQTALEILNEILRCAKTRVAEQGSTLKQFVTETVEDKLKAAAASRSHSRQKYLNAALCRRAAHDVGRDHYQDFICIFFFVVIAGKGT